MATIKSHRNSWKHWLVMVGAILTAVVPVASWLYSVRNATEAQREQSAEHYAQARADRAVVNQRLQYLDADVRFLMERPRCSP